MSKFRFNFPPAALPFLTVQRGEVFDALGQGRDAWKTAYEESIDRIYQDIKPHLPSRIDRVLDIGSGLGGIDAVLAQHHSQPEVVLFDGGRGSPRVEQHRVPFNDMTVARDFLFENGVRFLKTVDCYNYDLEDIEPCDLIISFAAYCFHIHPLEYLKVVRHAALKRTMIIFDVRKSHVFRDILQRELGDSVVISETAKSERRLFVGANMRVEE